MFSYEQNSEILSAISDSVIDLTYIFLEFLEIIQRHKLFRYYF
jgi:hypothetical protein